MGVTRVAADSSGSGWTEGPFDQLVASWELPFGGGAEVAVQARRDGRETAWYLLGAGWSEGWRSVPGQADADGRVEVDVLVASDWFDGYRLRARGEDTVLDGRRGTPGMLGACTTFGVPRPGSAPVGGDPVAELALEPVSQMAWQGEGGEGWCSPACLAMVLARLGHAVDVPTLARAVYDPAYGYGNWSANVAYVATLGLDAVVDRLSSLTEARVFLEEGTPLVCSLAAGPGELPGFPLPQGTAGHIVVLAGETSAGDPVVYDPAAPTAARVRRVYPRFAFERAWLEGSRGTVYVIRR